LGETLTEIAGEKAAIINSPNQTVVIAKQPPEAEKVILERCREFGITPIRTDFELPNIELSLKGKHQIENAKVAVCLAEILQIDKSHIINGLETARHQGRLEFQDGILFDGAHNIAGAKALREYLEEFVHQPITLIFGAMKDKQIAEIAEILFPLADKLILTQIDNQRSAKAEELSEFAKRHFILTKNVEEALEIAKSFSENLTCVTGSLYLVGEARKVLKY
jgi:dihydrofolate synthase/folylpolyglutamate synthase